MKVHSRSRPDLRQARVGATFPRQMTPSLITDLKEKVDFVAWGGDCYLYGLLANGHIDVVIEQYLEPFDYAAFGDASLKEEILFTLKNI